MLYWRNAGLAEYLTKGTLIELHGRIEAGAYINKDGKAVGTLNMHVEQVKLLGKTAANGTERADSKRQKPMPTSSRGQKTTICHSNPFIDPCTNRYTCFKTNDHEHPIQ